MSEPTATAPYGYDLYTHTEVIPKPAPLRVRWQIKVTAKDTQPEPGTPGDPATGTEAITVQLTADQQVELTISGEDRYDNPVDISGGTTWSSSDDSIVEVEAQDASTAIARAVGPAGTASVTVSNDVDADGTGDFQGSLAIDVVAGEIAEIVITPGEPTEKLEVNPQQ